MMLKKTPKGLTLAFSPHQSTRLAKPAQCVGYSAGQFIRHVLDESIKSAHACAKAEERERLAVAPSN
jgi:hypothetical protein